MTQPQPETCTTREAAKRLNVALSTVQAWVETGYLEAWKTPGGHRRIPLSSVEKLLDKGLTQPAIKPSKRFSILIVEDERAMRELYQAHIESWGLNIEILLADNGYDGLVKAASMSPDLMITDLSMPEMDGFKMIRAVRNGVATSSIAIFAVTGLAPDEITERGGIEDTIPVLYKPISFLLLKERVKTLMAGAVTTVKVMGRQEASQML